LKAAELRFVLLLRAAMPAIQVVTTTPSRELAQEIADSLVEERLAACVQVEGPILSTYRWQGKTEADQEWRVIVKTTEDRFDQVQAAIRQMHPYEVPEILAVAIVGGSRDYLDWLEAAVRDQ
jgi:periplasmic divalent cation tolerance protein